MTKSIFALVVIVVSFCHERAAAQQINPEILAKVWKAQWIAGPGSPVNAWNASSDPSLKEYGVVKFRKRITLDRKPASFVVHVSGDNRYKLFVNGTQVSQGPARGDLYFWNFETVDLAPFLNAGSNTVAAVIWNDGRHKPEAQISYLTGFILQGNTAAEEILNTDESWRAIRDESYQPLRPRVPGYYVAGPGEVVDMSRHVKGWEKPDYDDSSWGKPRMIARGTPKAAAVNSTGWMLVPSPIPQMEMTVQRLATTRSADRVQVPKGFPLSKAQVTVPPNTSATILLDQGFLTNAYPTLIFSKGKDATVSMSYAEALYIRKNENISGPWIPEMPKGNRNEIDGKLFLGKKDSLISDGSMQQQHTTLWWRTYRYVRLAIQTRAEPLVVEDIYGTFTGYPFAQNARLDSSIPELNKMLDIGWRTARLCAFETYMDCPFYEQLQYIGDARIQALVSYYNAGDDRLARHGLTLMDHSRLAEGITLSRYPTDLKQEIPTFSLWWIAMLHDYYRYRPDSIFIKDMLPGTRQVLSFFERFQQQDGSLKNVPYWLFTDWVQSDGWNFGMAPKGVNGESAVLDIQLLWTYRLAAELEEKLGIGEVARIYQARADLLRATIKDKYWDEERNLFADTQAKDFFSQHANSLAILAGVVTGEEASMLAGRLTSDTSMAPASIYFKYYLHQALVKAGLGNDYLQWLGKWRENIDMGLTTWAEDSDVSRARSDCHAWGSSPNIEFFRTVLGIDSDAPGFSSVKITPHLGTLTEIGGEMPHPGGRIKVKYKIQKGTLLADIELPEAVSGKFVWKGKEHKLKGGRNSLKL